MSSYLLKPSIFFQKRSSRLYVQIETERLIIRSYSDEDFYEYVSLMRDIEITRYFDYGKPWKKAEVKNLIASKGTKYFLDGKPFGIFSIFSKSTQAFIGQIDFLPAETLGVAEIGFILRKEYHNQGLCSEGLRVFISDYIEAINNQEFMCNKLPIDEVIATAHPDNLPSIRVLQKIGLDFYKNQERFHQPRMWFSLKIKNLINGLQNDLFIK